jgi:predicted phage gp36 major capsid-like protein
MDIFEQLSIVTEDQKKLESIEELQKAFNNARESCRRERNDTLRQAVDNIKEKMRKNTGVKKAVNVFISTYVPENKKADATEALYDMLSVEFLETLNTISHTSCNIF